MTIVASTEADAKKPSVNQCVVELDHRDEAAATVIAVDETLAQEVGSGSASSLLRIWTGRRAIVVPRWQLHDRTDLVVIDSNDGAWPICPRASGGTAVAHGAGTLNLSLIVPLRNGAPTIHAAYDTWNAILDDTLQRLNVHVDTARIDQAFCAGSYDVSVDGRKLAGVAQARRHGSVLVHGTILLDVDAHEYLGLVEAAERLIGVPKGHCRYDPTRITCLRELTGEQISGKDLAEALVEAASGNSIARHPDNDHARLGQPCCEHARPRATPVRGGSHSWAA